MQLRLQSVLLSVAVIAAVALLLTTKFLGSAHIVAGVLAGFLVSMANVLLLARDVSRCTSSQSPRLLAYSMRGFFLRFLIMGVLLYLLLVIVRVHPIGMLIGLVCGLVVHSSVVMSLTKKASAQ
jgi:hypothetical protein